MPGLEIMLPLAVLIALGFLYLFLWSVRNGDYDDTEMTAHRILFEEKGDVDSDIVRKDEEGARAGGAEQQ